MKKTQANSCASFQGNTTSFGKSFQPEILRRKKAVFRRHTLCMSRKLGAFPAEKIG